MTKEIEHTNTQEIVCPYCGYEYKDSWSYNPNDPSEYCLDCGKLFWFTKKTVVTYSTTKNDKVEYHG